MNLKREEEGGSEIRNKDSTARNKTRSSVSNSSFLFVVNCKFSLFCRKQSQFDLGRKLNFGPEKNFGLKTIFGPKLILCQQIFISYEKIWGQRKFWIEKIFG